MVTGEFRNQVDRIWEIFWSGGVTNPLSVIEQITYLLFIKGLDEVETKNEKESVVLGTEFAPIFTQDKQHLRWSQLKNFSAEKMYQVVSEEVFPFIKTLNNGASTSYAKFMADAIFIIPTPQMLERVVTAISALPLEDRDAKGDLYEYLLSKIAQSGTNGQFRTPRHIIQMMVELMKPTPQDKIVDPAAGTGGFLMRSLKSILTSLCFMVLTSITPCCALVQ